MPLMVTIQQCSLAISYPKQPWSAVVVYIYSVLHKAQTSQDKVGVKIKPQIIIVILHNTTLM